MSLFILLIFALNCYAFFLYGSDKKKSKEHKQRVSENKLLLVALFGGSLGALLGMLFFHHKTSKPSFLIKFGIVILIQGGIIYCLSKIEM